jgi:hypothetical protein
VQGTQTASLAFGGNVNPACTLQQQPKNMMEQVGQMLQVCIQQKVL